MSHSELFSVPPEWLAKAWINADRYASMYRRSIEDPEGFWGEHGRRLDWVKPYGKVKDVSFASRDLHIRWYYDGTLNACYNCVDRHLAKRASQTAIVWEGDDPGQQRKLTYRELHTEVCKAANALRSLGVKRGDRVTIYLPMIPEAAIAML